MDDPVTLIFQIIILVMSVILHELAHGYAANAYGDPTARLAGRLTLNPIPHIDPFGSIILPALLAILNAPFILGWAKPVPYNPHNLRGRYAETLVTAAGILTNLLLAVVFGLLIRFGAGSLSPAFLDLAFYIVLINVVLAIFNALPIPPLDGSKVLASLLPWRFQEIVHRMERWGFTILILFILFGWKFLSPVIFWLTSLIVGDAALATLIGL